MASYTIINNTFVSGELSPMMHGRVDSPKYLTGVAVCENFIPSRQGPMIKRAGTKYVAKLDQTEVAKLALFDAGVDGRFIVEFTNELMRFWTEDGQLVLDAAENPFTIITPYVSDDLDKLSCVMNKGVMYIVHRNYQPAKVEMGSSPPFTMTTITFTGGRTFDSAGDYPSCQAFKGGRWYLAATDNEPNAIFASRTPEISTGTDRFNDFTFSEIIDGEDTVLSTHAIYLQETDMYGSKINWLINQKRILAGAGSSIWMDSGLIATPATFDMSITLTGGSNSTPAKATDNYVIYAGPGGQSLNLMHYNQDNDGYIRNNISQTAGHIIKSGIKDFVVSRMRESVIWVISKDGTLSSCSLDPEQGLIGWARHPMGYGADGKEMIVKSLELLPGDETKDDVVWMTVLRSGSIYIETMKIPHPEAEVNDDTFYVDCGVTLDMGNSKTSTVRVLHLANEKVDAIGDGALLPVTTCDQDGYAVYDREFSLISIGFPMEARLQLLRPELPANGTSQGKLKQVEKQTLRVFKTLGGKVGTEYGPDLRPIIPLVPGKYELGSAFDLFSGDLEVDIPSYANPDGTTWIVSAEPLPFNLLAVMTKFGLLEV